MENEKTNEIISPLDEYRAQIDAVDNEMVRLLRERMALADRIGAYKSEHGLPVRDAGRERRLLERLAAMAGEDGRSEKEIRALYSLIFDISCARQERLAERPSPLAEAMEKAVAETAPLFPEKATVACQGVEGAYAQDAAQAMFRYPSLMFLSSFESVFSAVDRGLCRYGVLPLENSTAGSVGRIYDLMAQYHFYIVKTTRVRVSHVLAAPRGTLLNQIREVRSHEQALLQCGHFLDTLPDIHLSPCSNTAAAAKEAAASGRHDLAVICSSACAALYGLEILRDNINDESGNYTRFICISKKLEIYPGADRTGIMLTLPHEAGSLYHALARLSVRGINLLKIESRPIPGRDFEFMFYFDIGESIYSPALRELLCDFERLSPDFRYLGSY